MGSGAQRLHPSELKSDPSEFQSYPSKFKSDPSEFKSYSSELKAFLNSKVICLNSRVIPLNSRFIPQFKSYPPDFQSYPSELQPSPTPWTSPEPVHPSQGATGPCPALGWQQELRRAQSRAEQGRSRMEPWNYLSCWGAAGLGAGGLPPGLGEHKTQRVK